MLEGRPRRRYLRSEDRDTLKRAVPSRCRYAPAADAKDAARPAACAPTPSPISADFRQRPGRRAAGLSNEEFSIVPCALSPTRSRRRTRGASIEMYHGSHGRFETASRVRTFMTYGVAGKAGRARRLHLHAALIVTIPVRAVRAGRQDRGDGDHRRDSGNSQPPVST